MAIKDNSTNCRFCKHNANCDKSREHCDWELAPVPPEKMAELSAIETELRKIDWSDFCEATRKIISLESRLNKLDVFYLLFP
jgi:hypothetical protein